VNDLQSLKRTYEMMKKTGDKERIDFLDSIVSYCKYIGFDRHKTLMILGLIRNFIPDPGGKFTECSIPDDVDDTFTKKILDSFDVSQ